MRRNISVIVLMYLLTTVLMALQKPLFLAWYAARAAEASGAEIWGVGWNGLLLDSTTAAYLTVVPWLMMLVAVSSVSRLGIDELWARLREAGRIEEVGEDIAATAENTAETIEAPASAE